MGIAVGSLVANAGVRASAGVAEDARLPGWLSPTAVMVMTPAPPWPGDGLAAGVD